MDYRLDNMRISNDELILFDWGECSLAPPGFDLAYFMITSLTPHNRRAWEASLLNTYLTDPRVRRCSIQPSSAI